jgi:nucleotide-binding universal stress UspA family protein
MVFEESATVSEDMGLFEAAVHAVHLELERPALDVVVVVVDGSNQDETARTFAAAIARRSGAQVYEHSGHGSAAEILRACSEHKASLLVVPVPFGADIATLKDESLGAVVDMLLLESTCPVFCVRQLCDSASVEAALADVIVPVNVLDESCARAASWALRMLHKGERLELLAVADRDVLDEARKLLGEAIDPQALEVEAVSRAVTQEVGSLVAAVQRRGREEGLVVQVEVKVGRAATVELEEANRRPRLLVVGAAKDHSSPAYHRAADLILGAHGPVLVV